MDTDTSHRRRGGGVTQEDVGRLAGVSGKTVARVIARDLHVSKATREKVEAAIRQTGFRPNFAARSLAAARSYLIAIFLPDHSSLYHADLFRGAAAACAATGYHLLLEQYDAAQGGSALDRYELSLRRMRCDGVILPPPLSNDGPLIDRLTADAMPHVLIAPATDEGRSPAVVVDEARGVVALFDHLWSLGLRTFGLCAPPPNRPYLQGRNDIFLRCLAAKGAGDAMVAPFDWQGSGMLSGRAAAGALLRQPRTPDAIFAFNDEYAQGVMIGAQELGFVVPDALSVAGFDDGAAAQFAWPPLTTIRQPLDMMADRAVQLLIGGEEPGLCPVELVVRQSTGPKSPGCLR
ncbi:Transcriptional regulator [Sphingobium herbicidovorans NBRC 16415]|uniref:Transcriptional regulator n=1 Tax=Sphingobium herbicidovorans (strain ATCC 700291 / DSM 11019 / CCUG 56400 / KCTC 2939 / LMG 18315 / NBRC 16415 / MH) TaxID=1219045 RepID=A0A086PDA2_SPHHM|nr:LacI family DNA-binding transcriptional regulator [Sphingobium herbicidovorans]KFG91370.1 Transcriptional regulator [Sphingobium herbicidovorans NBRC 16415]